MNSEHGTAWIYYAAYRTSGNPFGEPCALYRSRQETAEAADEQGEWVVDATFDQRPLTEPGLVIEQVSGDYAHAVLAGWRLRSRGAGTE